MVTLCPLIDIDAGINFIYIDSSHIKFLRCFLNIDFSHIKFLRCFSNIDSSHIYKNTQKGLRQGDPLAPFLFFIVAEGLVGVARKTIELSDGLGVDKLVIQHFVAILNCNVMNTPFKYLWMLGGGGGGGGL